MFKRFIAAFDVHVGWERAYVGGKLITRRVDNKEAIGALLKFAADFAPDIFVFGGDQLNVGPVSHWNRGKPRLVEGFRFSDELDLFKATVLDPVEELLPRKARKIWLTGNHEAWWDDFLEQNPAISGMTGIDEYLRLTPADWEMYSQGEVAQVGKLYFMHGDQLPGGNKYSARRAVELYQRNIRFGHFHSYTVATGDSPLDVTDTHTAIGVPCLCNRKASYGKNAPNQWLNGFLYGYVNANTGNFHDSVAIIHNGRTVIDGVTYKAS